MHQGPKQPSEPHCMACTKAPSPRYGPDESKPQSLKNHLTAISYRSPPFFLREQSVPPNPPAPSPPLRVATRTQTDQSVQEVQRGWQAAELS